MLLEDEVDLSDLLSAGGLVFSSGIFTMIDLTVCGLFEEFFSLELEVEGCTSTWRGVDSSRSVMIVSESS